MAGLVHAPALALGSALSAFFALMRETVRALGERLPRLAQNRARSRSPLFRAFGEFFQLRGDLRRRRARRRAGGHAPRRRRPAPAERRDLRRPHQDRAGRGRSRGRRSGSRHCDPGRRWRRSTAPAIARSKRNCIRYAGKQHDPTARGTSIAADQQTATIIVSLNSSDCA